MFKILIISPCVYSEIYNTRFKDGMFRQVDIVFKDDLNLNDLNSLNRYNAILYHIEYPIEQDFFQYVEILKSRFRGVFFLIDYYDSPKHRLMSRQLHLDLYFPLIYGLDMLINEVRALLVSRFMIETDTLSYKDIELSLASRSCLRAQRAIQLRNKEFELLKFFIKNPGKVFSATQLLEFVWDMNALSMTNTVQAHISFLRKKVDLGFQEKRLHTVSNVGYKLE